MYTIANLIYGYDMTPRNSPIYDELMDYFEEEYPNDDPEFHMEKFCEMYCGTLYSGKGSTSPNYLGVKFKSFDECRNYEFSRIQEFAPTDDDIVAFQDLYQKLPEDIRLVIGNSAKRPTVWLIWSTS